MGNTFQGKAQCNQILREGPEGVSENNSLYKANPGVSYGGKCRNVNCQHYNQYVTYHKGTGIIRPAEDKEEEIINCPACDNSFTINEIIIYNSQCTVSYRYFGGKKAYKIHYQVSGDKYTILSNYRNYKPTPYSYLKLQCKLSNNKKYKKDDKLLSKVLVVIICIDQYNDSKIVFQHVNKKNMINLFAVQYNFDVITTKTRRCTEADYEHIIREAQSQFVQRDYQCVIMVFSGHGTEDKIIFSDWVRKNRKDVSECFSGRTLPDKIAAYKIFVMDACRGNKHAKGVEDIADEKSAYDAAEPKGFGPKYNKKKKKIWHPDANMVTLYPNSLGYAAYDEPKTGGVLINSLYNAMINDKNYNQSFLNIEDQMKEQTNNKSIDVKKKYGICQHPVGVFSDTIMTSRERDKIYFLKNRKRNKEWVVWKNRNNEKKNIEFI